MCCFLNSNLLSSEIFETIKSPNYTFVWLSFEIVHFSIITLLPNADSNRSNGCLTKMALKSDLRRFSCSSNG